MSVARFLAVSGTAWLAACAPAAPPVAAIAPPADASATATVNAAAASATAPAVFARLSTLVGRWRPADRPESPLRIHFYLTAGGTVLVESWEARGQPHSLTLYHRDGPALLATHYCPQGNQPRLALAGRDAHGLHFTFKDATDLAPGESYQHDLWLDLTDPDRPVRGEIYSGSAEPEAQERLRLMRAE